MSPPLIAASKQPDAQGTRELAEGWVGRGDRLCNLAADDEQRGRMISAGDKLQRAAIYFLTAERMQNHGSAGRVELYARVQQAFRRGISLAGANCERVEIPYGNAHIAGLYVRANGLVGAATVLVQTNGFDRITEMVFFGAPPRLLA